MNVQATAKFIRMAPRKTRLVVALIRGMSVRDARAQLKYSLKDAAAPVLKTLDSAVANAAHNAHMDTANLVVSAAYVNEGPTIHRYTPRAQGRATKIRKRMSHITIVVTDNKPDVKTEVVAKSAVKEKKALKGSKPKAKATKKAPAKQALTS